MLEVRNLTIEIELKNIIENISFTLNKGDKMAVIGEEGNGKSTLLKAIYDFSLISYANVTGVINTKGNRLGYLKQMLSLEELDKSVYSYLFESDDKYYELIGELYRLLPILGLSDVILEMKKMSLLSGGEKVKIGLLKILLDDPDILLLDEPTNDLDIVTLEWLEKFINTSSKPIIYVSHDEVLLEETANMILHLELVKKKTVSKYTVCHMGYKEYVETRLHNTLRDTMIARKEKQEREKKEEKLAQVMNRVDHELNTISRSDPHGAQLLKKKMKSLKSQEKRFEKEEVKEVPDYERPINLFFDEVFIPPNKEVLSLDLDKLCIGEKVLSRDIKLFIKGNDKIVILGKNGVGKTTLIRYIYNVLKNRNDIVVGYMSQDYDDILNKYEFPLDFLCETGDKDEISLYRSYMGNMNFTREEMMGVISDLSGGSKAKLILLKLIKSGCNVLILDEPTRNVSPLSNPVIRRALIDYKGTIISVSHDRKYIDEVCGKKYLLEEDGIKETN